jgi:hypothetical protein
MKLTSVILLLLATHWCIAQINMEDSTVQVIGFWDRNEKQTYVVSLDKYKIKNADTSAHEIIRYEVDVTIKDSTQHSYTIEWFYRDFKVESENPIVKKILASAQNVRVLILTDEMGSIREVVNWEEVRDYMNKMLANLRQDLKDVPKIGEIISQTRQMYSTRESIESSAIKDARQFYTFHGGKYKLGEVIEGTLEAPNLLGGEPFDSDYTVYLDEINREDDNYIMRATEVINPEQLSQATYNFALTLAGNLNAPAPSRDAIGKVTNETTTGSRIHDSGWPIYSFETKVVSAQGQQHVEERIIELK